MENFARAAEPLHNRARAGYLLNEPGQLDDSRKQVTAVLWDHPWFPQKTLENNGQPGAHQSGFSADSAHPGQGQVRDETVLCEEK